MNEFTFLDDHVLTLRTRLLAEGTGSEAETALYVTLAWALIERCASGHEHGSDLDEIVRNAEAALERLAPGHEKYAPAVDAAAIGRFWHAWNDPGGAEMGDAWAAFRASFPRLATHGHGWARRLASLPDLAGSLVEFARDRL